MEKDDATWKAKGEGNGTDERDEPSVWCICLDPNRVSELEEPSLDRK